MTSDYGDLEGIFAGVFNTKIIVIAFRCAMAFSEEPSRARTDCILCKYGMVQWMPRIGESTGFNVDNVSRTIKKSV